MTKEFLSNVRHKKEAKKRWKQEEVTQRTIETMSKDAGMGLGSQSLSGVESSKGRRARRNVSTDA